MKIFTLEDGMKGESHHQHEAAESGVLVLVVMMMMVVLVVVMVGHGVVGADRDLARGASAHQRLPVLGLAQPHLLAVEDALLDGQDDEEAAAHQELRYGILRVILQLLQHLKFVTQV